MTISTNLTLSEINDYFRLMFHPGILDDETISKVPETSPVEAVLSLVVLLPKQKDLYELRQHRPQLWLMNSLLKTIHLESTILDLSL
jgi:hypothetical protein